MFKILSLLLLLSTIALPSHADQKNPAHNIASVFEEMMQFIMSISHPKFKNNVPENFKVDFKKKFEALLNKRFTLEEEEQINAALHKAGGKKVVKMAKVMLETFASKLHPDKLGDIQLTLSPRYEETLEKTLAEKKAEENLKNIYLKYYQEKNIKKSIKDADNFARLAIKHLKKAISDNFSEEEYCSWYAFEKSELGKRLQNVLLECIALTFIGKK